MYLNKKKKIKYLIKFKLSIFIANNNKIPIYALK